MKSNKKRKIGLTIMWFFRIIGIFILVAGTIVNIVVFANIDSNELSSKGFWYDFFYNWFFFFIQSIVCFLIQLPFEIEYKY